MQEKTLVDHKIVQHFFGKSPQYFSALGLPWRANSSFYKVTNGLTLMDVMHSLCINIA